MTRANNNKQEELRKRIFDFKNLHHSEPNSFIVNHFLAEGVARSTIYKILRRKKNNISTKRLKGSGRKAVKMPKKKVEQLKKMSDAKDGISQRKAARKFNVCQPYINEILQTMTNINNRKKIKIPSRTEGQLQHIKTNCGNLHHDFANLDWILDNESYFTLSNSTLSGNDNFYTSDISSPSVDVKFMKQTKFGPKALVWIGIYPKDMTNCFIAPSSLAIKSRI